MGVPAPMHTEQRNEKAAHPHTCGAARWGRAYLLTCVHSAARWRNAYLFAHAWHADKGPLRPISAVPASAVHRVCGFLPLINWIALRSHFR